MTQDRNLSPQTSDPKRFESSMSELEQIVSRLEKGELSLDDAMQAFEKGVKLTRQCQQILDDAELKIQQLNSKNEEENLEPFNE
jgi:exodeoxyribonuclease VII small subunit